MAPSPANAPASHVAPVWLDRLAAVGWRVLVTVLLGIVLVAIAVDLLSVTASILVSLIAAAALAPLLRALRRRGLSRAVSAAAATALGLAVVGVGLIAVVIALLPGIGDIVTAVADGLRSIRDQLVGMAAGDVVPAAVDRLAAAVGDLAALDISSIVDSAILVGTVAVLALFLTYFLLQDGELGWAWLVRSVPAEQAEELTSAAGTGLDRVGRFLYRTASLAVIDAVVVAAVLTLLGVPVAWPLAVLVLVAGFVPYLGAIVAGTIVALATLATAGPGATLVVLAAFGATAVVSRRAIGRTRLGDAVGLHPVVVLVSIPVAAALFGVLGLVVVLPVIVFAEAIRRPILALLDPALPGGGTPTAARSDIVPGWLDRLAQWSWRALVVVGMGIVVVRLVVLVPGIAVPAVLAIVTAATLQPLAGRLSRAGRSRTFAAAGATVGAVAVVGLAVAVTLVWSTRSLGEILDTALEGAAALDLAWVADAVAELAGGISLDLRGLLGGLLALLLATAIGLLLTFFFLRDGPAIWDRVLGPLRGARRDRMDQAGERAVRLLSGYMIGTAIISLFGAVTTTLMMAVLGLPLAVPIGVLTFFAGFIPYIGSFISTAFAFLVAVAVGEPSDIAWMAVFTIVFNLVQGSGVAPIVYGKTLSLHPAIVLLAVPVGGEIAGILGMFLVVPFAAIISATWRLVRDAIEADAMVDPGPS